MKDKKPTLGQNIKAARLDRGMTQLTLAHACGYSGEDAGAYISRVEAGKQEPRIAMLSKIAAKLKVNLGELLG